MDSLLKDAYNRCKVDEYLEWDDDRYIDLSNRGVRGTDHPCTEFLFQSVVLSDRPLYQLFSGFSGSGKTTELKQLARKLESEDFNVIYVDAEEFLNLTVPTSISDVLITLCAGVDAYLGGEELSGTTRPFRRFWERLRAFLNTEVRAEELTAGAAGSGLAVTFKGSVDFKTRLYEAVKLRIPEFVLQCQGFLDESVALLSARFPQRKGTILILDSYEKLQGDYRNSPDVRNSVEDVFLQNWRYLQIPFHAIYTVPCWMGFMAAGAVTPFGQIHMLPMCRVCDPTAGKRDHVGVAALMDLLGKRFSLERVFGAREPIEELVLASGGYPRDLLRFVRDVLLRASMEKVPTPIAPEQLKSIVEKVIAVQVDQFEEALDDSALGALVFVAETHSLPERSDQDLDRIARLFQHHFVMSYRNGHLWYDVHPLLRRTRKLSDAIRKRRDQAKDQKA